MEKLERTKLIQFLTTNIEAFAWMSYEMPRIDPTFIKHELNILPKARPIKKRGRRSATEHVDAVIEEVKKLKEASAITEVLYLRWLCSGESALTSQVLTELV